MELTIADKKAIVARNFYSDNKDTYKDYAEALSEMENLPVAMIDLSISSMPLVKIGYRTMMKDGFVIVIRPEDGHVLPVSDMTQEEGLEIEKEFVKIVLTYPDTASGYVLMQKIGWKLL